MRGRKPIPTRLKILKGSQQPINYQEPSLPPGRPDCPEHLDQLARQEWDRLVPIVERMGILTEAEGGALMLYCECYSKWMRARADIAKRGLLIECTRVIESKRKETIQTFGKVIANPAVNIEIQMSRLMKEILIEFGLTPSARSRIKTGEVRGDRLSDFLAKQKKAR
jgi:P27 family predicted phage terminase small subunit